MVRASTDLKRRVLIIGRANDHNRAASLIVACPATELSRNKAANQESMEFVCFESCL